MYVSTTVFSPVSNISGSVEITLSPALIFSIATNNENTNIALYILQHYSKEFYICSIRDNSYVKFSYNSFDFTTHASLSVGKIINITSLSLNISQKS